MAKEHILMFSLSSGILSLVTQGLKHHIFLWICTFMLSQNFKGGEHEILLVRFHVFL